MKIILSNGRGMRESISNLFWMDECSAEEIMDACEDNIGDSRAMERALNNLRLFYRFQVDRETSEYVRFIGRDYNGNKHFLKVIW